MASRAVQGDFFKRARRLSAPAPLEIGIQGSIVDVLDRWLSPGWKFTHIPLGGERPTKTGALLRRLGTKAGWPDLILLAPSGIAHFLEVKRQGRGRLSEEQEAFRDHCLKHGIPWAKVETLEDAVQVLKFWGAVRTKVEVQ